MREMKLMQAFFVGLVISTILIMLNYCPSAFGKEPQSSTSAQQAQTTENNEATEIPDIIIGNKRAPIEVIQYSSLDCTHCAAFHKKHYKKIKKKFIDTGKVVWKYRHFPLDYRSVMVAAIFSNVPEDQVEAKINLVYEKQSEWRKKGFVEKLCELCDIPLEVCETSLKDENLIKSIIAKRHNAEKKIDIDGTPMFVVNGISLPFVPEYKDFEKVFLGLLESKNRDRG